MTRPRTDTEAAEHYATLMSAAAFLQAESERLTRVARRVMDKHEARTDWHRKRVAEKAEAKT